MAYFNMISYIYFLFCLIFIIHTFLCVSIMSASTCSNRCFLFFLVWRQNNSIEEIKRGTKIAVLSQLKLFFIIVRQGLKYVICFHMSSNGTRLFKCMPSCATKMKVHKSWDSRNFISHRGHYYFSQSLYGSSCVFARFDQYCIFNHNLDINISEQFFPYILV